MLSRTGWDETRPGRAPILIGSSGNRVFSVDREVYEALDIYPAAPATPTRLRGTMSALQNVARESTLTGTSRKTFLRPNILAAVPLREEVSGEPPRGGVVLQDDFALSSTPARITLAHHTV